MPPPLFSEEPLVLCFTLFIGRDAQDQPHVRIYSGTPTSPTGPLFEELRAGQKTWLRGWVPGDRGRRRIRQPITLWLHLEDRPRHGAWRTLWRRLRHWWRWR